MSVSPQEQQRLRALAQEARANMKEMLLMLLKYQAPEDSIRKMFESCLENAKREYAAEAEEARGGDTEMTFDEFRKDLVQNWPFGDQGAIGNFRSFLRTGCTEAEAKRWLGEHIWEFDDSLREKLMGLFAADALHEAARRPEPAQDKNWKIWKTCMKHKHAVRPDLWRGLAARTTEEEGRDFLIAHFKELPQDMQGELTLLFLEEGMTKKNQEDKEQLARKQKFLIQAKRFEETETERDPAKRKEKFIQFMKRFVEREGPISLS